MEGLSESTHKRTRYDSLARNHRRWSNACVFWLIVYPLTEQLMTSAVMLSFDCFFRLLFINFFMFIYLFNLFFILYFCLFMFFLSIFCFVFLFIYFLIYFLFCFFVYLCFYLFSILYFCLSIFLSIFYFVYLFICILLLFLYSFFYPSPQIWFIGYHAVLSINPVFKILNHEIDNKRLSIKTKETIYLVLLLSLLSFFADLWILSPLFTLFYFFH